MQCTEHLKLVGDDSSDAQSEAQAVRVLVVEDTAPARKMAETFLKMWGCKVTVAEDGKQALELASQTVFDLIYMDLGLPDMHGTEIGKKIRRDIANNNRYTPIVALTAEASKNNIDACEDAGFEKVLRKPLTQEAHKTACHEFVRKTLPIIDLEFGTALAAGDAEQALQSICDINNTIEKELSEIMQAHATQDDEKLAFLVHRLLGSLAYVGVPHLMQACQRLNRAVENGEYLPAYYKAFIEAVHLFQEEFNSSANAKKADAAKSAN